MKVAIIGYGNMGKEIEKVLVSRGHEISKVIDIENNTENFNDTEIAIIFSTPASAVQNIKKCLINDIPVVCGTTGWLDNYEEIKLLCKKSNGTFLFSPNFSIGVNLFFKLNKYLSEIMSDFSNYSVKMKEIHHTKKIDKPSGTAIKLAIPIVNNLLLEGWSLKKDKNKLEIQCERKDDVKGLHNVIYESEIDSISISHDAKSRKGFALGAVLCAEWIISKKGVFTMEDFLGEIKF